MQFEIITIFPGFFAGIFEHGIVRRAQAEGLMSVALHDLRAFTHDRHRTVDDRPFGGGEGMVLKPEPLAEALGSIGILPLADRKNEQGESKPYVILMSAQGQPFTQAVARELAKLRRVVLICGRYEGVDERVNGALVTDEISIGDYVLSGGESAAIVVTDAIVRLLPNALGSETSAVNDSFTENLLDYPHYTRPAEFRGMRVPEVLLNGHHAEIEKWRREKALEKTQKNRKDLLNKENG